MDLAGTEQAGACGWALDEGFMLDSESQATATLITLFRA